MQRRLAHNALPCVPPQHVGRGGAGVPGDVAEGLPSALPVRAPAPHHQQSTLPFALAPAPRTARTATQRAALAGDGG